MSQFAGMNISAQAGANATQGAQAYISHYSPRICSSSEVGVGSSSVWSMMANTAAGNPGWDLAQVGWLKLQSWNTSTPLYFYEWEDVGTNNGPQQLGTVPNPTDTAIQDDFTVYTDGSGATHFMINGVDQITPIPLNWYANAVEYDGEIHNPVDQIAGDTGDLAYFSGIQKLYNGTWYSDTADNSDTVNTTTYGGMYLNNPQNNGFQIWDTRYFCDDINNSACG